MSLAAYTNFPRLESALIDTTPAPGEPYLTGTGLDLLIDVALNDQGLNRRVDSGEITEAVRAMAKMNGMIVTAIEATGIGGDGAIETAEIYQLAAHIQAHFSEVWTLAHGDDEHGQETGFHLVQNDGATTRLFGENGINTVADGLYHLGFGTEGRNLINEDGNRNAQVDDVAFWLNALLAEDLAAGVFAAAPPPPIATTGTGLDALVAMIDTDQGLRARLPLEEIRAGAAAANVMNEAIVEGIRALGLANDGGFSAADVTALSDWIIANRADSFTAAHGDDEDGEETGFHLVQNDGANTRLFGENGVNTVADGIYHLVFGYDRGRLINEDGNANASLEDVADWLNRLLDGDMKTLANPGAAPYPTGSTGTGLDQLVAFIVADPGLARKVTAEDISEAAEAADTMNAIIVEGIEALDLAADGRLSPAEVFALSDWIRATRYDAFAAAHGDDENTEETGFHRVQNDGAEARMWGDSIVNTIADGIYHLVFGHEGDRLVNEDGDRNVRVEQVAYWLGELLAEDLAAWQADPGTTPTPGGLDQLVALIAEDPELNRGLPLDEIVEAMAAAQGMNAIIVEAIKATGVAFNGSFSAGDVMEIAGWINANRFTDWVALHGDDENGEETGFHLVQNDGAITRLYAENAVNTVADGIYHLGFGYDRGRLINEDGNGNASLDDVAYWLSDLLGDALADGSLQGETNPYDVAGTGTGLDRLIDAVFEDPRLARSFSTSDLAQAARAADVLNDMLLDAIEATGAANDGTISSHDIGLIDAWIAGNVLGAWDVLAGADSRDGDGFRKLIGEGASVRIDGADAIDGIGRALYALGHGLKYGTNVIDADGRVVGTADAVAGYLNTLLAGELADGSLVNPDLLPADPASFADALVAELGAPVIVGDGDGGTLIAHDAGQEIDAGAIAISFTADDVDGWQKRVLLSKDHSGYEDGGLATIWVANGRVYVRLQDDDQSWVLTSPKGSVVPGRPVDLVLNFGPGGAALHIDGELVAENADAVISWALNDNPVAVGESRMYARDDTLTGRDPFDGEITAVRIYDRPLDVTEVLGLDRPTHTGPGAPEPLAEAAVRTEGSGLVGAVYDTDARIASIDALMAGIAEGSLVQTHSLATGDIAFAGKGDQSLSDFVGGNGAVTGGDGETAVETMGVHLSGYIWIDPGRHSFTVRSDDGFALQIGGEEMIRFTHDRWTQPTMAAAEFEGGLYKIDLYYFENTGAQTLELMLDGEVVDAARLYPSIEAYETAPVHDPAADGPARTGTGLDALVDWIETDSGLVERTSADDRAEAGEAAAGMNAIIVEAIKAMGAADDGHLTTGEVYDIADWINANHYQDWLAFHGDDEAGVETGFHRVQNDGGETRAFGDAAINTVADGIYHLGFGTESDRLLNEDGNRNARVEQVAMWLNALLAADLEAGSLVTGNDVFPVATTGTGLDRLVEIAAADVELLRRIPESELIEATQAMEVMNGHILDGIRALGLANDGLITAAETAGLSDYIARHFADGFTAAHGDDEDGEETGFHLVQNDGAITRLFAENAINTVADGIYHLVFGYDCGRLINEDGNRNAALEDVGAWLTQLLAGDMASLANPDVAPVAPGDTGTGLDALVTAIAEDTGLNLRLGLAEIQQGAEAANAMNHMIVDAIKALGFANDGVLLESEVRGLAEYITATYGGGETSPWVLAHGDDEAGIETGFHLVQNDGATGRMFNENAVDTVADGIYHLGFGYHGWRLVNEDGNANQTIADVADWLNDLLAADMAALANPEVATVSGTTGTGLDAWIGVIMDDLGLNQRLSVTEITDGAMAADAINRMIVEGITATGIARDGQFNAADMRLLSDWIAATYNGDGVGAFWLAHGDDDGAIETGFHLVQNDGATTRLYGENAVNTVFDGTYHLGFGYRSDRLINEDGNANQTLSDVAYWLEAALAQDIASGALVSTASADPYVAGTTGTGLDGLVEIITRDDELGRRLSTAEIAEAAAAADGLNTLLLEAMAATAVTADGQLTSTDLKDISLYLQANAAEAWAALHGDDSGFDLAWQAGSALYGRSAVREVADAIYNLGFGFRGENVQTETGGWDERLSTVADWLTGLLGEAVTDGSLAGAPVTADRFDVDPLATIADLSVETGADTFVFAAEGAAAAGSFVATFVADSASAGGRQVIVSRGTKYDDDGSLRLELDNGRLELELRQDGRYLRLDSGDLTVEDGATCTVGFSYDADRLSLYVGGTKVDLAINPGFDFAAMDTSMLLGAVPYQRWDGRIDPVHVFDGVVTDAALYGEVLDNAEMAYLGHPTESGSNAPDATLSLAVFRADDLLALQ